MRYLLMLFLLLAKSALTQSDEYLPFIDTTVIFEGEQDSIIYVYQKTNKGMTVTAALYGSTDVIFRNHFILEKSEYFVNYEDGSKDVFFSIEPKKNEQHLSQNRNSRVISLKGKLNFRNLSYKNLLVVETWFGDYLYPCKYYFARGIGLIAFSCEDQSMYYRIFDCSHSVH